MKDKELKLLTLDQLRSHVAELDSEIIAAENREYRMRDERRRANNIIRRRLIAWAAFITPKDGR